MGGLGGCFGVPLALGIFGRGGGWWFAGASGAGRGWGLECASAVDFSSVGVCFGFGSVTCPRGPGGLLIIVALLAVGVVGALGFPSGFSILEWPLPHS